MKLRWLPSARRDLRAQLAFIERDDAAAAARVRGRIVETVRNLCLFPNSGRAGVVAGTREMALAGLPFIVVYRCDGDILVVLRVLHTATNWKTTKN